MKYDPITSSNLVQGYGDFLVSNLVGWEEVNHTPEVTKEEQARLLNETKSSTDVVYGWRGYRILWGESGLVLSGSMREWPTNTLVASCYGNMENCAAHVAMFKCSCGIHGFTERDATGVLDRDVVALCVAYGWVAPYTNGWRAEKCRIEKLFWNPRPGQFGVDQVKTLLESRYGVEVEIGEAH